MSAMKNLMMEIAELVIAEVPTEEILHRYSKLPKEFVLQLIEESKNFD